MYKSIGVVKERLFEVIDEKFGNPSSPNSLHAPLLRTHERSFIPRLPTEIVPDLFPWAYHEVTDASAERDTGEFVRFGRDAWYTATITFVIIGMGPKTEDKSPFDTVVTNPAFLPAFVTARDTDPNSRRYRKPTAWWDAIEVGKEPGVLDIAGQVTGYMQEYYQSPMGQPGSGAGLIDNEADSVPLELRGTFTVPRWKANGLNVLNHAIHREVAPQDTRLIKVWQINFQFDILEDY